jgi:cell division protein FtsN
MASRKDFASKKKPARKKTATSTPKAQQPVKAKAAPPPQRAKKPWKLLVASVVALGTIITVLYQLTQVDPKEIRETGISALIEDKLSQSSESSPTPARTTIAAPAPKPVTAKPAAPKTQAKAPEKIKAKPKPVAKVPVTEKSTQGETKEPYQFYKILAEDSVETETIEAYKFTPKTAKLKNSTLLQTGSFRNAKDAERMKARLILNNFPKVKVSKSSSGNGTWYRVRTGPFITFNQLKSALTKLNKLNISPIQIPLK